MTRAIFGIGLAMAYHRERSGARAITALMALEQPQTIKPAPDAVAAQFDGVDILVNCTSGTNRRSLVEIPEEMRERCFKVKPPGKAIEPEAVADLAVFLAPASSRLISGTAINVDGGWTRSI